MSEQNIEKLVSEINESSTFARILEVGAGVPTANQIYRFGGASKTVFSTESYYAREAFDKVFGECSHRAVSFERLRECIFENDYINEDMVRGEYNTIFASTFQVGYMNNNNLSTHGWIGVSFGSIIDDVNGDWIKENLKYYHISIHKPMTREEYINTIGEIGVKLLHCKNEFIPSDCWIDIVLDEEGNTDYKSTLEAISNSKNVQQASIFSIKGADRIESITRGIKNLVIYKGSFNPVTIAHEEVVKQSVSKLTLDESKIVFSISVDTFQKGTVDINSLIGRIKNINSFGYDVLITNNGLFVDCLDVVRTKYQGNIIFPLGVDTINRLSKDYHRTIGKSDISSRYKLDSIKWTNNFDTKKFEQDFKNCELICFSRDDEEVDSLLDSGLVSHMEQKHEDISSSKVRELFANGEDDIAIEMIPHEIRHYVISNFSNKNK